MTGPTLLIIEDDRDIWRSLEIVLTNAGYTPRWAPNGHEGLAQAQREHPALVILDLGLPGLDGWSVLDRLRIQSDLPIIMLTARGLETDKVRGLLGGADDYLTKPFNHDELVARVGALLRRSPAPTAPEGVYEDARVRVDFVAYTVEVDENPVSLTPTEFNLLAALLRHPGQVLSPGQLLEQGWKDPSGIGTGRVKYTVLNLRRKLGWSDPAANPIESVRGFGYRYQPPAS